MFTITTKHILHYLWLSNFLRISATSISHLDLIYVPSDLVISSGTTDSDHSLVYTKLKFNFDKQSRSFPRVCRLLKNINLTYFNNDLVSLEWHRIYEITDINDQVEFLNNTYLFNKHAPLKFRQNHRKKHSPWVTDIKLLQKLRNDAIRRYKTLKTPHSYDYYKELRNFTTAIRNEKSVFETRGHEWYTKRCMA